MSRNRLSGIEGGVDEAVCLDYYHLSSDGEYIELKDEGPKSSSVDRAFGGSNIWKWVAQ